MPPDFSEEIQLWSNGISLVVGADEVGRGAFAGPVVAAAVIFPPIGNFANTHLVNDIKIDDSKKLTIKERIEAELWIKKNSLAWGVGECPAVKINTIGIVKATQIAFRRAIKSLNKKPEFLLVDGYYLPFVKGLKRNNQKAIIRGDGKSLSIASASILAKVYRDGFMRCLSKKYKEYYWDKNSGYGTKDHIKAIQQYGITKYHRKLFIRSVPGYS